MNFWDIALVILLSVILVTAVIYRLRRRKRGRDCGCENCPRQCFRRK
ncbi:MAG: FeoB-associated Cys-rich membrane protein [Oscillospiraceae bacterium]|nr:FeoB-associated Cys-rich membrane protein [Oscillospiraceae bacterium]